jgi:hypothetical protein
MNSTLKSECAADDLGFDIKKKHFKPACVLHKQEFKTKNKTKKDNINQL